MQTCTSVIRRRRSNVASWSYLFVLARGQIVLLTRAVFSSPTLNIMLNTRDDNVSYSSADICKTTMLLIINESDLKQLTAEFLGRYAVTLVDKEKKNRIEQLRQQLRVQTHIVVLFLWVMRAAQLTLTGVTFLRPQAVSYIAPQTIPIDPIDQF